MSGLDSSFTAINLGEPEPWSNRRSVILGLVVTFLVMSTTCALTRLYTRLFIVRTPGWDDLCIFFLVIFSVMGSICVCLSTNYGFGQHFILLSPDNMRSYLKTFYVMNGAYSTSTTFIKEALLLQYLRIYDRGHVMRKVTLFVAVFVALWGIAFTVLAWVPCMPPRDFWETPPNAKCWGYGSQDPRRFVGTFEAHTAINMVLDVVILSIPMPLLFERGTIFKQKMRVLGLLFMGSLAIILAIWRLATIIDHQAATWPTHDPTWYGPISVILATLEVDIASMCASIPIFWPMIEERWGTIFITQEIKITREDRLVDDDDQFSARHMRVGSDADLKQSESGDGHYHDTYVMQSVDPLRTQAYSGSRVEAMVRSESSRDGRDGVKKWVR